ncbi:MAG TPA: hypothetical protein VEK79_18360 [Thermoanaerobaculia bacterium]|nr:hypothetical protein [Thermoanaerobaculia bacterium]
MRALILVLLLVVAHASFAEAIVGKTRILVVDDECHSPYWVPLTGGSIEPIFNLPSRGSRGTGCNAYSAAYDGERFLINVGGGNAAFIEEGAFEPSQIVPLDDEAGGTSAVRWDGTRYIAVWRRSAERGGRLAGAAITREGAIIDDFRLASSHRAAGLTVNNGQVLVLDAPGAQYASEFPDPARLEVLATILDAKLTPRKLFVVGNSYETLRIGAAYMRSVEVLDAHAFGDGFYVAWMDTQYGWGGVFDEAEPVRGTRITADGTMLDVTPAMNGRTLTLAKTFDVDLMPIGEYLLAVVKREHGGAVTGTFIDKNGLAIGTRELLAKSDDDRIVETVRLPDGKLALLTRPRFGATATITPVNEALPLPRRRAVR